MAYTFFLEDYSYNFLPFWNPSQEFILIIMNRRKIRLIHELLSDFSTSIFIDSDPSSSNLFPGQHKAFPKSLHFYLRYAIYPLVRARKKKNTNHSAKPFVFSANNPRRITNRRQRFFTSTSGLRVSIRRRKKKYQPWAIKICIYIPAEEPFAGKNLRKDFRDG